MARMTGERLASKTQVAVFTASDKLEATAVLEALDKTGIEGVKALVVDDKGRFLAQIIVPMPQAEKARTAIISAGITSCSAGKALLIEDLGPHRMI